MADELARAHLIGQDRIRALLATLVAGAWDSLPGYDARDVSEWLATVVPLVTAAQRQSAALTNAYVARELDRQPLAINLGQLTGDAVRNGVPAEERWRRPFVNLWSHLADGAEFDKALASARARATSMAATDVQLTHRATYSAIQDRDTRIRGWRRSPDGGACKFCLTVAGAFVKSANAMALHNHCGCGLTPVLDDVDVAPLPESVAVHEHGEMGAVLADPAHQFTGPDF
jgi:hypothetical protein